MTRTATVVVGLIVLLLAVPAGAQDSQGTVTRYYLTTVKAGHDLKWEQAFKAHVDWHRQQNDTWAWDTYMLVTGERLGQYITISGDHAWADFDAPSVSEQKDAADVISKLGPHVESLSSGFWTERTELSRPPEDPLPSPLIQIVKYRIKPGKNPVFVRAVELFGEANDKTNWTGRYFWFVEYGAGAAARTFWRIVAKPNWASMQPVLASSFQAMAKTYGDEGLQSWIDSFGESVESVKSELWQHRPDLSYVP